MSRVLAQVGHRAGALGLVAVCAGVALMVSGKRPFVPAVVCGFCASAVGVVASSLARRWEPSERGLLAFNVLVMAVAVVAMVASRLGWWHVVGLLAGGR